MSLQITYNTYKVKNEHNDHKKYQPITGYYINCHNIEEINLEETQSLQEIGSSQSILKESY